MVKAHLEYAYTLKQIAKAAGVQYTKVSIAVKKAKKYCIARPKFIICMRAS